MKPLTKQERERRIVAKGESENHFHVVTGDVSFDEQGRIIVGEDSNAAIKHLLGREWMEGKEVWSGEHTDIKLTPGVYEYVPQKVYDPLTKRIEDARD